ncbi:MAG: iron-containing alcohol dehydrogenase, partial [Lentisphaeria bacterium]|nr:iron-containing alcohol dehydrogenase [Lentisphaeria bacterium]NQZ70009.1 iron-containing alcohol dehydrogenase [Lentisphaeria bacterium]
VAKTIKIAVSHPSPLAQYDDALGGDALLVNPMPACYAIPTTAGTGSEVGRCSVIIMRDSGLKTLFFHPTLLPPIAVLDPLLTVGLPPHITAATGIDAYTHCLEAYFVSAFHPMADAIAVEGMKLILENLRVAVLTGTDLPAREKMQVAAAMGATAFQKGLGMIHSLAHPLSTQFNTHHGLANALLLPASLRFLEAAELTDEQKNKFNTANDLFKGSSFHSEKLSESCTAFFESLGIEFGLSNHGIADKDLTGLAKEAIGDPCHATNMVVISEADLLATYTDAL